MSLPTLLGYQRASAFVNATKLASQPLFSSAKNKKYRTFYRTHFLLISITCLSRYISLSFYRPALFSILLRKQETGLNHSKYLCLMLHCQICKMNLSYLLTTMAIYRFSKIICRFPLRPIFYVCKEDSYLNLFYFSLFLSTLLNCIN